jgi:hypothetical protein
LLRYLCFFVVPPLLVASIICKENGYLLPMSHGGLAKNGKGMQVHCYAIISNRLPLVVWTATGV